MEKINNFIKKYKWQIIAALAITFASYVVMLTTNTITVDEETWMSGNGNIIQQIRAGRIGTALFLKLFTNHGVYVSLLCDIIAILLWSLSGILAFAFLYERHQLLQKASPTSIFIAISWYNTIPYIAGEALCFSFQSVPVTFGMCCAIISAALITSNLKTHNKSLIKKLIISVFLTSFSISFYQANLTVFIVFVCANCLLYFYENGKLPWRALRNGALCGILSVIVYFTVNRACASLYGATDYLSEFYIGWGKYGPTRTLLISLGNAVRVLFGFSGELIERLINKFIPSLSSSFNFSHSNVYGGIAICIITLILLIYMLARLKHSKGIKNKILTLIYTTVFALTPFSMYIVFGTLGTSGRLLISFPLMQSVLLLSLFGDIKNSCLRIPLIILISAALTYNAIAMNLLYYSSYDVYQNDVRTAHAIMKDIENCDPDYEDKAIAFIGCPSIETTPLYVSGTLGYSVLTWDDGNQIRMQDFLATEGYNITVATSDQLDIALEIAENMPCWPSENSIIEYNDMIIVHFSDPYGKWYAANLF